MWKSPGHTGTRLCWRDKDRGAEMTPRRRDQVRAQRAPGTDGTALPTPGSSQPSVPTRDSAQHSEEVLRAPSASAPTVGSTCHEAQPFCQESEEHKFAFSLPFHVRVDFQEKPKGRSASELRQCHRCKHESDKASVART